MSWLIHTDVTCGVCTNLPKKTKNRLAVMSRHPSDVTRRSILRYYVCTFLLHHTHARPKRSTDKNPTGKSLTNEKDGNGRQSRCHRILSETLVVVVCFYKSSFRAIGFSCAQSVTNFNYFPQIDLLSLEVSPKSPKDKSPKNTIFPV